MSKKNPDRADKGRLAPFVPLLKDTLQTPTWRAMSHGARSLYVALRGRVANDCRNNGRVFLPTRAACAETGSSSEQIVRWFEELQHYGFIVQVAAGHLGVDGQGKAPHWRLTELGARNADGNLDMPTRDFLRWNGVRFHRNRTTFEKQNPVAESRNTPLRKAETPALRKAETQNAQSVAESRSIQPPKELRKAEAYLDNHLGVAGRSGAQPPASAAPRTPHTDDDDGKLQAIEAVVSGIIAKQSTTPSSPDGLTAIKPNGERVTLKIGRKFEVVDGERLKAKRGSKRRSAS